MITARNSWYLMANAVSGQLATRRGLAADHAANSAPGPNGSTIWVSGLGGYDSVGAGGGSPGFTAGLGGAAAGIDVPVAGTARSAWRAERSRGKHGRRPAAMPASNTAQFVTYGQWQSGMFFAEAQLGLMYLQENVTPDAAGVRHRDARASSQRAGRRRRRAARRAAGARRMADRAEPGLRRLRSASGPCGGDRGGALAETIGGASLGSAESTLAVSCATRLRAERRPCG